MERRKAAGMPDTTFRAAERTYRADPTDPYAAVAYRRACERAGEDVPLDLLFDAPFPPATLQLPKGIKALSVKNGYSSLRLNPDREWVVTQHPRVLPAEFPVLPGPLDVPLRTSLLVTLKDLKGSALRDAVHDVLLALGRERLELRFEGEPSFAKLSPLTGLPPIDSLKLAFYPQDWSARPALFEVLAFLEHTRFGSLSVERARDGSLGGIPDVESSLKLLAGITHACLDRVVERCPTLRELVLPSPLGGGSWGALPLARLPRLERLQVCGPPDLDPAFGALLCNSPHLERLRLFGLRVTGSGLLELAEDPKLTHLMLSGLLRFDRPKSWRRVAHLRRLRWLVADDVPSVGVKGWERLRELEHLSFSGQPPDRFHNVALSFLPLLPRLRTLLTDRCGIDTVGAQVIARCLQLRQLDLRHEYSLNDRGLKFLAQLPRLKWLGLIDTGTTVEGREALRTLGLVVTP
jgi:hypothetical protein